MLLAQLELGTDPRAVVRTPDMASLLADSARWDLRLPYVRREFARHQVIRNKADAAATLEERRSDSLS